MIDKLPKLSSKEEDVMSVFWTTGKSLTVFGVTEENKKLKINTVKVALPNLLKKGYLKIDGVVYRGTAISRTYFPIITCEEYLAEQFRTMQKSYLNFSTMNFVNQIVKYDEDKKRLLEELEKTINIIKKEIK